MHIFIKFKVVFLFLFFVFLINNSYSQSLEEKIGQMIMVGFTGTDVPDSLKYDIEKRNLGGIVLFASNITNPIQLKTLTNKLKLLSKEKLFIGVDQEGGKVARLNQNNGYEASNSAYYLGTIINREDSTRFTAAKMATWLNDGGINLNLAPVVDVNVNPLNPVIALKERSYSDNPFTVTNHAKWFIEEFNKKGVLTVLKHFPGHGSSMTDSHLGFTDITNTWKEIELIPYKELINKNSIDFIMIGHLYNKYLDSLYPASLSKKVVTELLRDSLKFKGLVISDELFMNAISDNYTFDFAIELCIKSGTDILLFKTNIYNKRSLVGYIIETVSDKVRKGIIPEELINNSYERIMKFKNKFISTVKCAKEILDNENIYLINYPNPFNSETIIKFSLPESGDVRFIVYDALGKEVAVLVNDFLNKGQYVIHFNSKDYKISSGVYFYTIFTKEKIITKKMLLMK